VQTVTSTRCRRTGNRPGRTAVPDLQQADHRDQLARGDAAPASCSNGGPGEPPLASAGPDHQRGRGGWCIGRAPGPSRLGRWPEFFSQAPICGVVEPRMHAYEAPGWCVPPDAPPPPTRGAQGGAVHILRSGDTHDLGNRGACSVAATGSLGSVLPVDPRGAEASCRSGRCGLTDEDFSAGPMTNTGPSQSSQAT
jgi:hypothetical protein